MPDVEIVELLPCPFCGGAPDTFHNSTEASIYCPNEDDCCGAHVHIKAPMQENWPDPWPVAVAVWNRRTPPSQGHQG
jgi:hypothetical protein